MTIKLNRRDILFRGVGLVALGIAGQKISDDGVIIQQQKEKLLELENAKLQVRQEERKILHRELMDAGSEDTLVTLGYEDLNRNEALFLDVLRTGVGQIRGYYNGINFVSAGIGTAELIDRDGTLWLTAHQAHSIKKFPQYGINFSYNNMDICSSTIAIDYIDNEHDIAIATMLEPDIIDQFDLRPVELGRLMSGEQSADSQNIILGFPHYASDRLHAGLVSALQFIDQDYPIHFPRNICSFVGNGSSFPGNSGGGIFQNKKLIAVVTRGSDGFSTDATVICTPTDIYRNIYINLFPERARSAGIGKALSEPEPTPAKCRLNLTEHLASLQR